MVSEGPKILIFSYLGVVDIALASNPTPGLSPGVVLFHWVERLPAKCCGNGAVIGETECTDRTHP